MKNDFYKIMNREERIHQLLTETADEILAFIKESESAYPDRWMPAAEIKRKLGLNLPAVPKSNANQSDKGWLFGILARMLEDRSLIEFKKEINRRSFYRSR